MNRHFRHNSEGRIVTTPNEILINEYSNNPDFTEITEWVQKKLSYLEEMHGKRAAMWFNENDDRKIYSNLYDIMHEALLTVAGVNNNFVLDAMNHKMRVDYGVMGEIYARFKQT